MTFPHRFFQLGGLLAASLMMPTLAARPASAAAAVMAYRPYVVEAPVASSALMLAAHAIAAELGASVIRHDGERLTAVVGDASRMHDRLTVVVHGGNVEVDYRTHFAGNAKGADVVCRGYSYSRERSVADAIVRRAALLAKQD